MADGSGRANQKLRTRKELIGAAAKLMKSGARPTLEEVAAEALVSRATAYRYFPSIEALLAETALDIAFPDAATLFAGMDASDVLARVEKADAAVNAMVTGNEMAFRQMLITALSRSLDPQDDGQPIRQNRRAPLIAAALEPARGALKPAAVKPLSAALAVLMGLEARIVLKDVLQLSDADADGVRRWMLKALVAAART